MVGSVALVSMPVAAFACAELERETIDRVVDHEPSVWTSQADCESLLPERPARTNPRIGTWNVQYFPDTEETETTDEEGTDVPWLACAIASLDVDVLAVQEFKTTDRARQKAEELVARLNELTAGDWQLELAPCLPHEVQHPGFLYDASRVTGTHFREIPILNPDPVCSNDVSPGFGGYFEIADGPDFHLVSVHMQAGSAASSIERRRYSLDQIQQVIDDAQAIVPDSDIIFTGDFNTSGCDDCNPPVSSDEEVAALAQTMVSMDGPLTVVGASQTCSFQDDAESHMLLDHFVVAQSADEMPSGAVAHVSGICEEIGCDRLRNWLEDARDHLSDHCPVLLDLAPQDDD
jgi:endonuclease/exonuclease/phosphatase family metal-dependent hydrolase